MSAIKRVPVVILNGFLGSGKTTLFRNLLAQARKQGLNVKAIVNDMSELDVDGELLGISEAVEENQSILVSIHACVLSSSQGLEKLDGAIQQLCSQEHPELLIIETSGSCHPMPLIEYFKGEPDMKLTGVFALVDSLMLSQDFDNATQLIPRMQHNVTTGKRDTVNLLVEQVMFSSHVLLTKTDRISEAQLAPIAAVVQNINPYATAHSVHFGKLDIQSLLELPEYGYFNVEQLIGELKPALEAEAESDRPYDLTTRVIKDERPFHPQRLWDVCHEHLDQRVYRSKGFFWLASRDKHALLWNQAAGGISLEIIGSWRAGIVEDENHGITEMEISMLKEMLDKEQGRFGDRHCDLTVIGDQDGVDRFTEALTTCFLSEEEIELWQTGHAFEDPWPQKVARISS